MVYKIRHCNDDTKIKTECAVVVIWWLLLSIMQNILYIFLKL